MVVYSEPTTDPVGGAGAKLHGMDLYVLGLMIYLYSCVI